MGRLVSVVGNTGVGKTTFASKLCQGTNYYFGIEEPEERPFQELFMIHGKPYALANQIDYLLYRAQQEIDIRKGDNPGIQDGGLDMDFHIFTNLFFRNGYLSGNEYEICKRAYYVLRANMPAPDLFIWMKAPVKMIAERYDRRDRRLDIAQIEDMKAIDELLENWLSKYPAEKVFEINAQHEDRNYSKVIPIVRELIESIP